GAAVCDRKDQPVRFIPKTIIPGEERIQAGGPQLTVDGRPMTILGVNYWPSIATGKGPSDFKPHWLAPGVFDPVIVARDLDRLREAGINAISVQYLDPSEAPQFQYLVEEARLRRMWVDVFVGHLQPFDQDFNVARAMIREADLPNLPRVFAVDIAWEPRFGTQDARRQYDAEWRLWLEEQYGNAAHAEFVLRHPLWRHRGQVTCPTDKDLQTDGPHRAAVAAYRRFLDDTVSRRYGEIVRFLRREGVWQLVSARTGFGGTGSLWADPHAPFDPVAGAVHLDFISPEAWGLVTEDEFAGAGFITAYSRGVTGGKPVVWKEFGASVGQQPGAVEFRHQVQVYERMFDLALRSRSSGCFAWWYPGGWRVDEGSDMGIVNPDGTWRPVRSAFTDFAFKLRQRAWQPPSWKGREVDRDADARGLSGLWEKWRAQYRDEMRQDRMEEVRPVGFERETETFEPDSVGGVTFDQPAPLSTVNAEWGRLEVDGKDLPRRPGEVLAVHAQSKVRMELINSGAATWSASVPRRSRTVWVRAKPPSSPGETLEVPATPPGGRIWIEFVFREPGLWVVRPWLSNTGEFGERLRFDVHP
ncbi:MAG TPA: hypothetical protein VIH35_08370, partial [Kiritimatiellia bacterium]